MRKAARVDARTAFKNGILPDENARASHLPCQPYKQENNTQQSISCQLPIAPIFVLCAQKRPPYFDSAALFFMTRHIVRVDRKSVV